MLGFWYGVVFLPLSLIFYSLITPSVLGIYSMSATKFGVLSAAIPVGGGTKTGAVQTGPNCIPVGILTPAAMSGTAITFEVLVQGETTYQPLYNGSSVYSLTVAANRYVALDPDVMMGVQDLKIVSGSSESAGVTFKVIQRPVR